MGDLGLPTQMALVTEHSTARRMSLSSHLISSHLAARVISETPLLLESLSGFLLPLEQTTNVVREVPAAWSGPCCRLLPPGEEE